MKRSARKAAERRDPADDEAVQLLHLAARFHAARGDPAAWMSALEACRNWFSCVGALDHAADASLQGADELEALAGRVTHCATYGDGDCGCGTADALKRARCAALAPQLHEAAAAHRRALRAACFELLPPTWILDSAGRVQDANAAAKKVCAARDGLAISDGRLAPDTPGGSAMLRRAMAGLGSEGRFSWLGRDGVAANLLLRPLPGGAVTATLLAGPLTVADMASRLAQRLALTLRQAELAAHLLAGHTLTESARAMGISRDTANEHLAALLRRTGAADRRALLVLLRPLQQ